MARSRALLWVIAALWAVPSKGESDATNATPAGLVTELTQSSLEEAIRNGPQVSFAVDGTIWLTNEIAITSNVVIDGAGHQLVVDGRNNVRLFRVDPGATLRLVHLTLSHGRAKGKDGLADEAGGAGLGGAIFNSGGRVELKECQFNNNPRDRREWGSSANWWPRRL